VTDAERAVTVDAWVARLNIPTGRRPAKLPPELATWASRIHAAVYVEADGSVTVEGVSFLRRYASLDELQANMFPPHSGDGGPGRNRFHTANVARAWDAFEARQAQAGRAR